MPRDPLEIHAVTPERWSDLERLFGPKGAYGGCWCMWFRLSQKEFTQRAGDFNRRAMRGLVRGGRVPGLLAYLDGDPVGWVSVAPREQFPRVERSPTLKPIDERPAWSIVCFYIHKRHRGEGVGSALLRAAVDHAREQGARLVEGYPEDPATGRKSNSEAYTGVVSMFEGAGFREVARRGQRPIMRRVIRKAARR